ncbi:MAG: acyl--CoA ligase [Deltaproteobacteria bacterium]|nr:acyl--CoA ligase [Deltaproteobacteria bacterium]
MRIGDLIERRARNSPERVFWQGPTQGWTYGELERESARAARALWASGLRPGSHVALYSGNRFAYASAHFGAARAGLVLAHLNGRYAAPELAARMNHSQARLLFFGAEQMERVAEVRTQLGAVRQFVMLPEDESPTPAAPPWAVSYAAWLEQGLRLPSEEVELLGRQVRALDPALPFQLLYTSGTTGHPKGALISHRAKLRQGTTHALNLGLVEGDRVLSALPLCHQFAQWLILVSVPLAGATVVARPALEPGEAWRILREGAITHLPAVPTLLYRLLDHPAAEGPPPPHLRCIVYGAAPIAPGRIPQLRQRFPGTRLFQGFGQTETGYCLGLHDSDHEAHGDTLGRPDLFGEIRLLDPAGREVAPGEVGEIVARSPYLMNGYFQNPEATAEYFAQGPQWGRTGDLAWRDPEGFYHLAGRKDDLVISGGVNIYPAEVERVLESHERVREAAAFGVPDPEWGHSLAVAVLLREAPPPEELEALMLALKQHCRAHLAGFKCPRRFYFPNEFPRTDNGKVQKFLLRSLLIAK